ncbi:hypothetical protein GGR54DRAFT_538529 [Hypoxylon sp. NC1633]|nr:hypothetical protein GGR54DRAFT_538529 [Hypoxylon sp. NC1633]
MAMLNNQQNAERSKSPLRRQRACAPCTKAKARCHFEANKAEDGCDRCRRMRVTCTPQTTKSLRRPRQVKPASGVTAKPSGVDDSLSAQPDKYDHILIGARSRLHPKENSAESSSSSPSTSTAITSPLPHTIVTNTLRDSPQASLEPRLPSRPQQSLPSLPAKKSLQPGFGLTWEQAEQAISDFKINYIPFFPFVALGHDVSAREILSKKPLLFRAIMLAAAPLTFAKERDIQRSIQAYIGQHLLVMEERDLGMLQGLLVFISWYMNRWIHGVLFADILCRSGYDFYFDQRGTSLTYLAMGYAHNLAITRPPPTTNQKLMVAANPQDIKEAIVGHHLTTVLEESHTPEEQRAFLGCQYLLSINSSQFGRDSVLKSVYIEYCLNSLVRPTDLGEDFILDKMIRFQKIVEQITERLLPPKNVYEAVERRNTFTSSMGNEMQLIHNQINQLFANIASKHRHFVLFWTMHSYVLVRLYLPALNVSPPSDEMVAQQQKQCMVYCLDAARTFFTTVLSIPPEGFLVRSFVSFFEMFFVLTAASRLLLIEIDGWDLAEARESLDLLLTLERLIAVMKTIFNLRKQRILDSADATGMRRPPDNLGDEKKDRFYHWAIKLEWMKNWFEAQMSGGSSAVGEQQAANDYLSSEGQWNPFMFGWLGDEKLDIEF